MAIPVGNNPAFQALQQYGNAETKADRTALKINKKGEVQVKALKDDKMLDQTDKVGLNNIAKSYEKAVQTQRILDHAIRLLRGEPEKSVST